MPSRRRGGARAGPARPAGPRTRCRRRAGRRPRVGLVETSRPMNPTRTPFALALSATAASANGSMSIAVALAAPGRIAAIAHSPDPVAKSTTRWPALSGCSRRKARSRGRPPTRTPRTGWGAGDAESPPPGTPHRAASSARWRRTLEPSGPAGAGMAQMNARQRGGRGREPGPRRLASGAGQGGGRVRRARRGVRDSHGPERARARTRSLASTMDSGDAGRVEGGSNRIPAAMTRSSGPSGSSEGRRRPRRRACRRSPRGSRRPRRPRPIRRRAGSASRG